MAGLLAVLGACQTSTIDLAKYTRDGRQYGVTEGRFRGRWWNYYQRGRSFSDGAFWTEAESDMRLALSRRQRDQLWARTYGLHFLPEYFPHRELGIVLYHDGRVDEAIPELELSLSQTFSARAAYYLDRIRRERVSAENADRELPTIEITSPGMDAPYGAREVDLAGVARDDTYVTRILIEGRAVDVKVSAREIPFSRRVTLNPGQNTIAIQVGDISGKVVESRVSLVADMDGPTVSFNRPVRLPGVISGEAIDTSGVRSIRVAGKEANLAPDSAGPVRFDVELTVNEVSPPVQYEAEDALGNLTRGVLGADSVAVSLADSEVVFASGDIVSFGRGASLAAYRLGGTLVLASLSAGGDASDSLAVRLPGLRDGQRYFMEEILVNIDVVGPQPITDVSMNGQPLSTMGGRSVQRLSRRIPLVVGPNHIAVAAKDEAGNECAAEVSIERAPSSLEAPAALLNLALMGNVRSGNDPVVADELDFVLSDLHVELQPYARFTLLDRSMLPTVLSEQELSAALASPARRAELGQVIPADAMVIGRIHHDVDSIEIVAEAVSTETSAFIARADVAGQANTVAELTSLCQDLALRLVQAFPRVQGEVIRITDMTTQETPARRASLGIATGQWMGNSVLPEAQTEALLDDLEREILATERFHLVNRDALDALLAEQDLSRALASPETQLALDRIAPAGLLLSGNVQRSGNGLQVALSIVDIATQETTWHVQVESGEGLDTDSRAKLAHALAKQLAEAVPGPAAEVVTQRVAESFACSLSEADRIRESMKCLIYRPGAEVIDPVTQQVLGRETQIVGEGLLESVTQDSSRAQFIPRDGLRPSDVRPGDYVATK